MSRAECAEAVRSALKIRYPVDQNGRRNGSGFWGKWSSLHLPHCGLARADSLLNPLDRRSASGRHQTQTHTHKQHTHTHIYIYICILIYVYIVAHPQDHWFSPLPSKDHFGKNKHFGSPRAHTQIYIYPCIHSTTSESFWWKGLLLRSPAAFMMWIIT